MNQLAPAPALSSTVLTEEELRAVAEQAYSDPVYFCRWFLEAKFTSEMPWLHRGLLAILTRQSDFLIAYGELSKIVRHFVYREDPADDKSRELPIFEIEYSDGTRSLPCHHSLIAEDGKETPCNCWNDTLVESATRRPVKVNMKYTRFVAEMIPRGFSKTTLAEATVLFWILYKEVDFALFVGETQDHAETRLGNVKSELEFNERIRLVFGNLKPDRQSSIPWTGEKFETTTGVFCQARGRGTQVRGLLWKGKRPDRVIVDDLENEDSVATPEQRAKAIKWFFKSLKPVIDRANKAAGLYVLGTLLHPDALLMSLSKDRTWTFLRFGAIDRDGQALWPYSMTLDMLEKEKYSYQLQGQLSGFYMEYLSQIRTDEEGGFAERHIIYMPRQREPLATAIVIDPAISDKVKADFCGFGVVSIEQTGILTIEDVFLKKGMTPREQIDKYFELAYIHKCTLHGVEAIAYQAALIHLLKEEMYRKGQYFEIQKITHGTDKVRRIKGVLQPRYAAGYVRHARRFPEYETQLLEFPNGKRDGPDVVAMAITLLDPYAAAAADPTKDLGEDEYEPINKVLGGDWRQH
jgi:hypothetical protein